MTTVMMGLEWTAPEWWIAGAVALAWIVLVARRSLVDRPPSQRLASLLTRAASALLVVAALAGLHARLPSHDRFVVLCLDESASLEDADRSRVAQFVDEFRSRGGAHRLVVLPFAKEPGRPREVTREGDPLQAAEVARDADARLATDLQAALAAAEAAIPAGYQPHVLLFSDGLETQGQVLRHAADQRVPVSTIPLVASRQPEVQLVALRGPVEARVGEPFELEVVVDALQAGAAELQLFREELPIDLGENRRVALQAGENRFTLRQQVEEAGPVRWTARVLAAADTRLDDNQASVIVGVAGQPRILLVDSDAANVAGLQAALEQQEILAEVRDATALPDQLARWLDYDAVVLSNVPANLLSTTQVQQLRSYVEDFGGGLAMLGGEQSFGLGGYARTPLEAVLPVRCSAEKDQEQPTLAMVLVVDRSGSMGGEKLDLAKDAARAAIELLSPRDQLGMVAFDNEPHWITPLQGAADKTALLESVGMLDAAGGTNLYPALQAAYDALRGASARIKHVLVLSDGISAPADDASLLAEMANHPITVSTIALGDKADKPRLREMAQLGNGRFYECDDPRAVPQVFVQETMMAGQSALQEEPFVPVLLRSTPVLRGIDLASLPPLLGYVSTGTKPTSELVMVSEKGEPLLAWWRYGLGMSLAFTSDAGQRWAVDWQVWPDFARFWAQCVRHIARRRVEERGELTVRQQGVTQQLTLDLTDRENRFLEGAEVRYTIPSSRADEPSSRADHGATEGQFTQTGPGRYQAEVAVPMGDARQVLVQARHEGEAVYQRVVSLGGEVLEELRLRPVNEGLLRELTRLRGGLWEPTAADLLDAPAPPAYRLRSLAKPLLALAVLLLLLDVALRRLDWGRWWSDVRAPRDGHVRAQNTAMAAAASDVRTSPD
jgi:uncharacterized membrane protein/uncharacterized protein YegL